MIFHGGPDGGPEPRFDFSSNANALGPNPVVLEAVRAADLSRYPDPAYTALRTRLGAWHGVPAGRVVVGAGASELIHRVVRVFGGPVLTLEPTFGEYAAAARAAGVEHLATYGPEAFLEALPGAGVAFLAQPDNPSGEVHEAAFLDEASRRAREGGARLVVDLAYAPLVEGDAPRPAEALQLHAPNKAHGLVGVRAGYLVLPPGLAAPLVEAAPSWVIGPAAVAFLEAQAGEAARAWVRSTRPRLWLWRRSLAASLRALGYEVREGAANFLMARLGAAAAGRLRRRSIRVRPLDDKGLPDWARLSAQPPAAQQALLRAAQESS
ncbi:aspartate aminotransferase [Oceanithermus desulfurans NBRC 100063]|uniref:histidinol-phosphate transaminase n=1 Tax=Oceanithermus desulfurans NBRC 100063 TaxID=1227550 RepID=A0A511RJF7_9DEIN|nr:aspartate aminotransferase [Oceanithermus desulfurans NBRC 100063]